MELKKQFVLVPPMTEPLNKLNEVYENNSEENAEVSIIDDLRELNQFVAITGQCLVVFSNPKKCANFLQENKTIISKSHCKIILISPLDIPAATLAKFKKAGLTESILESSPPKKIIYKISLQLRSLKTNQLEVAKDQLVKSLIDTNPISSTKAEIISNSKIKNETASADENDKIQVPAKEKKEVKERDIFQNLKGKTNFKEESIDTKWKTQRDTLDLKL
jgi:predicted RNA-binding protein with PIN domain